MLDNLLKPIADAVKNLMPYRREEFKYEFDLRLSESPPCHQRQTRVRDRWTIWHSTVHVTHVRPDGTFTAHKLE